MRLTQVFQGRRRITFRAFERGRQVVVAAIVLRIRCHELARDALRILVAKGLDVHGSQRVERNRQLRVLFEAREKVPFGFVVLL